MSYAKTIWVNDTTPAINADNLNKIEQGIYDADIHSEEANTISRINLNEKDFFITSKYIDYNTGSESSSGNYKRTDFIPVKAGEKVAYYGTVSSSIASIAFYTSNSFDTYIKANSACYTDYPATNTANIFTVLANGYIIISLNVKQKSNYVYFETSDIPRLIQDSENDILYIMKDVMNEEKYSFTCLPFTTQTSTRINSEGTETSNASWNLHTATVVPHDIILITGAFSSTSFSFGYDESDNIVCRIPLGLSSSTAHEEKDVVWVVPYNVKKIKITASSNSKYNRIKLLRLTRNDITNEYISSHLDFFATNGLSADGSALYDIFRLNSYFTVNSPSRIVINLPSGYGARVNEVSTGNVLINRSDYFNTEGIHEFFVNHSADLYVYFTKLDESSFTFSELESSGCKLYVLPEQIVGEDARLVDKSYITTDFVFKKIGYFAQNNLYGFTYSANYKSSERILCYQGETLYYTLFGGTSVNVIYVYDLDGNVIDSVLGDGYNVAKTGTYTFTQTCYIRLTTRVEQIADISFNNRTYWDIMNRINSDGNAIPSYWISEVEDTLEKVRANQIKCGANCVEFIFVTDWHWDNNAHNSPSLVNRIAKKSGIKNVLLGGDAISYYHSSKEDAIEEAFGFYEGLDSNLNVFTTLGNHDRNGSSGNTDRTIMLTDSEAYAIYTKRSESFAVTEKSVNYGYWDFPVQKVRIVMFYLSDSLYPNMVEEQYVQPSKAWAISKMEELDSSWTVILLTHGYYYGVSPSESITETNLQIKDDILECKKNMSANLAFWILGHVHDDYNAVLTSSDSGNTEELLQIVTNCDAMMGRMYTEGERTLGTDTEQSFDVVQVDTLNKKVYLTRCGAGNDREFSYD